MRASAYRNKKQKAEHAASGNGSFGLTLALSQDEAEAFVKGDKNAVLEARKALKTALSNGPAVRAASDEE